MLDVEFEWFDPQPNVDYHGIKSLLQQLFDSDAQLFDLSALTDLILSQPTLGSTVKVDGNETDPYAFLSILNLQEHKVSIITLGLFPCAHSGLGQAIHCQSHSIPSIQVQIESSTRSTGRAPGTTHHSTNRSDLDRPSDQCPIRDGTPNVLDATGRNGVGGAR